jgi:hypothetical protein
MCLKGLFMNHLQTVFLFNDDHLTGGSWCHRDRGWRSSRGCDSVSSIAIVILVAIIFLLIASVLTHTVESNLIINLHDELVVRLDHSLQGGLLLS